MAYDFAKIDLALDDIRGLPESHDQGRALENLVAELFASMSGVVIASRNVRSFEGDAEIDLVLRNRALADGLEAFQRDVFVECKTQGSPLSSRDVDWFATQVAERRMPLGILVSLSGISGANGKAAQNRIAAHAARGVGIIVLVEEELRAVTSPQHLAALIEIKRQHMAAGHRVALLSPDEIEDLDTTSSTLGVHRSLLEKARRHAERRALDEILDRAALLARNEPDPSGFDEDDEEREHQERVQRFSRSLLAVDRAVDASRTYGVDPLWMDVRDRLIDLASTALAAAYLPVYAGDARRAQRLQLETDMVRGLRPTPGGELWSLLTLFYESKLMSFDQSRAAAFALVSLAVEAVVTIDEDLEDFSRDRTF